MCSHNGLCKTLSHERRLVWSKIYEYDQKIPQSHTATNLRHREEEPQNINKTKTTGRQFKQSNQFSSPRLDDGKTRKDTRKTQSPYKPWEVHKLMNQKQQNHCLRTDSSLSHFNAFYWRQIFALYSDFEIGFHRMVILVELVYMNRFQTNGIFNKLHAIKSGWSIVYIEG